MNNANLFNYCWCIQLAHLYCIMKPTTAFKAVKLLKNFSVQLSLPSMIWISPTNEISCTFRAASMWKLTYNLCEILLLEITMLEMEHKIILICTQRPRLLSFRALFQNCYFIYQVVFNMNLFESFSKDLEFNFYLSELKSM